MKNIQKHIVVISFLSILVVFASCKKDDVDNTKPTITVVEPADDAVLHPGEEIHFDCEFADDVELKSYKIDIHINEDGHGHTKTIFESENAWTYNNTWNFEAGKKNADIHHHEIVIPEIIDGQEIKHGHYHFGVYCTDVAGNESNVFIEIEIEDVHP